MFERIADARYMLASTGLIHNENNQMVPNQAQNVVAIAIALAYNTLADCHKIVGTGGTN